MRVLAADLGVALGGGAHLRALRRTAVGPWNGDRAMPLDMSGVGRRDGAGGAPLPLAGGGHRATATGPASRPRAGPRPGRARRVGDGPWRVPGPAGT